MNEEVSKGSFSRVFDFEANDDLKDEDGDAPRTSPFESRFPINIGITGYVAATGEVSSWIWCVHLFELFKVYLK